MWGRGLVKGVGVSFYLMSLELVCRKWFCMFFLGEMIEVGVGDDCFVCGFVYGVFCLVSLDSFWGWE